MRVCKHVEKCVSEREMFISQARILDTGILSSLFHQALLSNFSLEISSFPTYFCWDWIFSEILCRNKREFNRISSPEKIRIDVNPFYDSVQKQVDWSTFQIILVSTGWGHWWKCLKETLSFNERKKGIITQTWRKNE